MSDALTPASTARRRPALEAYALVVLLLVWLGEPPPAGVCVLGDLRTYLAGRIPARLAASDLDATPIALGLGKAAVGDWSNLGDAVVAGGRLYLRGTAVDTLQYHRLVRATRFRSSSFAFLPPGAVARTRMQPPTGSSVAQLLQQLTERYPRGVLAAGYLQFSRLELWAVSRPAIYGVAVPDHVAEYYTEPLRTAADAWAYVVGISARQPLPQAQRDDPLYQRLLAPHGAERQELNMTYALLLAAPPTDRRGRPTRCR
ncbi:MAG: hypothetical protein MZV65_54420 [Chromatiales bacterium]|nr:hypothetical protein [Chromatiales bacterium]